MGAVLRRYRLLIAAVLILCFAALREESGQSETLPYVMLQLYPDSPRVQAALGIQAVREGDLQLAQEIYQKALSSGVTTNEDLLYYNAVLLICRDADADEITAAVDHWQFHFPYSARKSPRKALESATGPADVVPGTPTQTR